MTSRLFVVHLKGATARAAHVRALVEQAPLPAEVVDAVDGRVTPPGTLGAQHALKLRTPHYPFAMRPGEIGCFLSHRQVWRRIVDEGLDHAVIIEDDMRISPETFDRAVRLAAAHVGDLGYIQFNIRPRPARAAVVAESDGAVLVRPEVTLLGTVGQMVSRTAAERLLAATERFDRPIDVTLQMHWVTGVRVHAVFPSGLTDASSELGGSTIGARKSLWSRLEREWKRFRYRSAIRRLSRRFDA